MRSQKRRQERRAVQRSPLAVHMTPNLTVSHVTRGSPYIPVDSWVYPAVLRLYALGYVDKVYLGMRPWTRVSLSRMLDETEERLEDVDEGSTTSEAEGLYESLKRELRDDSWDSCATYKGTVRAESVYSVARAISGTPLRDSYHLGSTIVNDYGRPYANGFNNYSGASGYASAGRFLLYVTWRVSGRAFDRRLLVRAGRGTCSR